MYLRLSSSFLMMHSVFERLHCVQSLSPGGTTHCQYSQHAKTHTYAWINSRVFFDLDRKHTQLKLDVFALAV